VLTNHKQQFPASQHSQRGALGLLGILTLLLVILCAALAVDTGRLMMEQRHLQTVADMAALDAAAQAGNCGSGDFAAIEALASASAARNNHAGGPLTVQVGQVAVGTGGLREFSETEIETATAVRVLASKTVPASLFAGGTLGTEATLRAAAVAERDALAGFSAGTMLLSLSDDEGALLNSMLSGILGSPVGLDVLSYQGIAATNLSLGDLVDASASFGTVDELLSADLSMAEMLNLYADAVAASGTAEVEVANGLDTLIAANISDLTANFGEIVAVTTENPQDAADADINLMDLITTSALVANGEDAINLPLSVNLPAGLLNVSSALTVTEAPQIAVGPPGQDEEGNWRTQLRTAQVELATDVQSTINLNVAGLTGARVDLDLRLEVNVAQGRGWLKSIQCGMVNNNQSLVTIGALPGVAMLNLTQATDPSAGAAALDVSAIVLFVRVPVADVEVGLSAALQTPTATDLNYLVNPLDDSDLPQTQTASTAAGLALSELPDNLQTDVTLLGAVSLPLLDTLIEDALLDQVLTPLLSELGTATIDPLLSMLGIEIGAMDVKLISVDISRPEMQR